MNKGKETISKLIKARSDATKLLELKEKAFNQMALLIKAPVHKPGISDIRLERDTEISNMVGNVFFLKSLSTMTPVLALQIYSENMRQTIALLILTPSAKNRSQISPYRICILHLDGSGSISTANRTSNRSLHIQTFALNPNNIVRVSLPYQSYLENILAKLQRKFSLKSFCFSIDIVHVICSCFVTIAYRVCCKITISNPIKYVLTDWINIIKLAP